MTAQEKATKLVERYIDIECDLHWDNIYGCEHIAIHCATIAVDEIIDQLETIKEFVDDGSLYRVNNHINYYEKVKEEINKI